MSLRSIEKVRQLQRRLRQECSMLANWWLHEMRDAVADEQQRWASGKPHRTTIYLAPTLVRIEQRWRDGRVQSSEFQRDASGAFAPECREVLVQADINDGTPVHLVLPPSDVLIRRSWLPAGAEQDLAAVVDLLLERELPLSRDQVQIDWRIEARNPDGTRIDVAIAVVRRSEIERLLDAVSQLKLRVLSISVDVGTERTAFNFAPRRQMPRPTGRLASIDRWLARSAAALVAMYVGLVGGQWLRERSVVDASLAMANVPAQRVERMRARLTERSEPLTTLLRLMQSPSSAEALAGLTAAIPNDSWLPQLEIHVLDDSATLRLMAITPAATLLVERLESSPHIESVKLQSANTAEPAGRDRVELSAHWVRPALASTARNGT